MPAPETATVVCIARAAELESLSDATRSAGPWTIAPLEWPKDSAARSRLTAIDAYVVHHDRLDHELVQTLASRPPPVPLVMIGGAPVREVFPNIWLPSVPPAPLLGSIIQHFLQGPQGRATTASPSWRRKSDMIIGSSQAIRRLLHSLDQLAPAQTPVIITGESGVGKELVAQALHYTGPRAKAPFVAINCAAIPDNLFEAELFGYQRGAFTGAVNSHAGAFETANRGTLFLDEIGEMPVNMQAKLLRVLQTGEVQRIGSTEPKKVSFRLVSATNRNLVAAVKEGRFREDLYYRIQVYPLYVAPLRERVEDIPALAAHHLSVIAQRESRPAPKLTTRALEKLVAYSWPGNVRELVNILERSVLLAGADAIDVVHVVFSQDSTRNTDIHSALVPYKDAKTKFEKEYFVKLLRVSEGNISLAAKIGQKTRKEIYDAIERLGLDAAEYRTDA